MKIDGFSLSFLCQELDATCQGSRVEKLWQPTPTSLVLQLRKPGCTEYLSINASPDNPWIYRGRDPRETPETPPAFCMLLRKHLGPARLSSIHQIGLDRVLCINFDLLDVDGMIRQKQLYVELIGKYSNLIFVIDATIVDAARRVTRNMSQVREILPGLPYQLPPDGQKADLRNPSSVTALCREASLSAQAALIKSYAGLGKTAAIEILHHAGIPPEASSEFLSASQIKRLESALHGFIHGFAKQPVPTVVEDSQGKILSITHYARSLPLPNWRSHSFNDFSSAVRYTCVRSSDPLLQQRSRMLQLIGPAIAKNQRKLEHLRQEKEESLNAAYYRTCGDLLYCHLHELQNFRGVKIEVNNVLEESPATVWISLDPALSVADNAQRYYKQYRKLRNRLLVVDEQIERAQQDLQYWRDLQLFVVQAETSAELANLSEELVSTGLLRLPKRPRKRSGPIKFSPTPCAFYEGFQFFVGRSNHQNDFLTHRFARPHDYWFHAKDMPGSHVIVRIPDHFPKDSPMPSAIIERASLLAAYFSKSRFSSQVPVDYTQCRNVKKPSGAKPGYAIFERQRTAYVTPDNELLHALLLSGAKKNEPS